MRELLRFRSWLSACGDAIWCYEFTPAIPNDAPKSELMRAVGHGVLVECNDACARYYRASSRDEVLGKTWLHNLKRQEAQLPTHLSTFVEGGYHLDDALDVVRGLDGIVRHFRSDAYGVFENGRLVRIWGTSKELPQQNGARHAAQPTAEAEQSIASRERTLRELYHRMGNDFQLLASVLSLHSKRSSVPEASRALEQAIDRIHTMASVYKLLRPRMQDGISLTAYTNEVVNSLRRHTTPNSKIRIQSRLDDAVVMLDLAAPLGLLLNELLSTLLGSLNAEASATISIRGELIGRQAFELRIHCAEATDERARLRTGSVSSGYVRSLCTQIGAQLDVEVNQGTEYVLRFGI